MCSRQDHGELLPLKACQYEINMLGLCQSYIYQSFNFYFLFVKGTFLWLLYFASKYYMCAVTTPSTLIFLKKF